MRVYHHEGLAAERQSSIIVLLLKEVDAWPEMTASKLHSLLRGSRERSARSLPSASRVGLGGLVTPALGFELEPGVPQRLCKVVVHRTCDGHRVGHGLCFFVVFPQAAAEVFLDHGVARRVRYGGGGGGGSRQNI